MLAIKLTKLLSRPFIKGLIREESEHILGFLLETRRARGPAANSGPWVVRPSG